MHIIHEYGLQLSSTQIFVTSPMTLQNPINCFCHRPTVVKCRNCGCSQLTTYLHVGLDCLLAHQPVC